MSVSEIRLLEHSCRYGYTKLAHTFTFIHLATSCTTLVQLWQGSSSVLRSQNLPLLIRFFMSQDHIVVGFFALGFGGQNQLQ